MTDNQIQPKNLSRALPVLLIRPDANERDAAALDAYDVPSTIDPWLRVRPADDAGGAHRLAGYLQSSGPQAVLTVTSPRTWPMWAKLVGEKALKTAAIAAVGRGMKVYCTGKATKNSLPNALAKVAETAPTGAKLATLINEVELPRVQSGDNVGLPPVVLLPASAIGRPELPAMLKSAGWRVFSAGVYTTEPVPVRPASVNLLAAGAFSAVVLRSPSAVAAFVKFTADCPAAENTKIIAAGPTTTRAALDAGLIVESCSHASAKDLAAFVAQTIGASIKPTTSKHVELPATHPFQSGIVAHSNFLAACRGERPQKTPVWFMRQAGRSLPEYRAAREGTTMLESCLTPQLASELTLQPVRRYGVDAAIFYSDIMVPLKLAGIDVTIEPGIGPVIAHPVTSRADVEALPTLTDAALEPIRQAIALIAEQLGATPLIGFAGAPYTVASYLVEGRPNQGHPRTRALMRDEPQTWAALLDWVARIDIAFLRAQVLAGASAVQLFDSWVGELGEADYLSCVQPASGKVLRALAPLGVPRIHFGTKTAKLLVAMRNSGADVMGVAADLTLEKASELLGGDTPLQGNINPAILAEDQAKIESHVAEILASGQASPGHIVNLAHGVPKDTDPDVLAHIVDCVHDGLITMHHPEQ